uniref:ACOX domain-containing protein n=1 Tax=Ascaris lumbricoides TaxID=6252 RepID=A0A0M3IXH4_ASCLU
MKKASTALGGQKHSSSESIEYLFREGSLKSSINQSSGSNYIVLIDAFEHLARRLIFTVYDRMENLKKCGRTSEEAFNECSVDLCKVGNSIFR